MSARPSSTSFYESGDLYSKFTYSSECDTDNESDLAVCKDKLLTIVLYSGIHDFCIIISICYEILK